MELIETIATVMPARAAFQPCLQTKVMRRRAFRADLVFLALWASIPLLSLSGQALAGPPPTFSQTATIPVGDYPTFAVANPAGTMVYVVNTNSNSVSVIETATNTVLATIAVGSNPARIVISPDGSTVYVGNTNGGVSVINTSTNTVTGTISTGYGTNDIALTPDGTKLYLAFVYGGVGLVNLPGQTVQIISTTLCPEGLAITPDGSTLFVVYQCYGPGGSSGHDAIGVFSVATNSQIRSITGLPNVGHPWPAVSPDGSQFWESGDDACTGTGYDGAGCPSVPGIPESVVNVIQVSSDSLLQSLGIANPDGPGFTTSFSPDSSTAFLGGNTNLKLVNTSTFATTTTLPIPASGSLAFVAGGNVAYAPVPTLNEVAVFSLGSTSPTKPTVHFTGAPANAVYGSSFVVTATTNASTTAAITAGGACSISGNTVTMTAGTGSCTLTATWGADSDYSSASLQQTTMAVKANQATLTVTGPLHLVYGNTGAATAAGGNGSGALSFSAGSSTGCSVSGTTVSVTSASGTCSLTATKLSDSNYNQVLSPQFAVSLSKANTTTSVTLTTTQKINGTVATLNTTIVPQFAGTPTGIVTYSLDVQGNVTTLGVEPVGTPFTTPVLALGTNTVIAVYDGDGNFSQSGEAVYPVGVPPTAVTLRLLSGLEINPLPDFYSVSIAVQSGKALSGTVTLYDGTTALSATQVPANGQLPLLQLPPLAAGTHNLTAVYGGNSVYPPGESAVVALTVRNLP